MFNYSFYNNPSLESSSLSWQLRRSANMSIEPLTSKSYGK